MLWTTIKPVNLTKKKYLYFGKNVTKYPKSFKHMKFILEFKVTAAKDLQNN